MQILKSPTKHDLQDMQETLEGTQQPGERILEIQQ